MPVVDESIVINRPRSEVYAYLSQPNSYLEFQTNLSELSNDNAEAAVGNQFSGVNKVAGRKVPWTAETTEVVENEVIASKSLESPLEFTYSWRLADEGDGTLVSFHQEVGSLGGFFGRFADPLVVRMYARDVSSNLDNLKALLEAESA